MPACKNDPKAHYSASAPSPTGRGFCAHAYDVGKRMTGNDGKMWQVILTSNGIRRWSKVKKASDSKQSPIRKKRPSLYQKRTYRS